MLVDVEAVLVGIKRAVAAKPSHGARDLLATIAKLEAEHSFTEGEHEAHVRTFAHHYFDTFIGLLPVEHADIDPLNGDAASSPSMVEAPHLRRPRDSEESCKTSISRTTVRA